MERGMSKLGGSGRRQGDPEADLIGVVRRSPDGHYIAVKWPSPPSRAVWMISDYVGSNGYEESWRIAHWPVAGAMPFSPAAGMALLPIPAPPRGARQRTSPTTPPPDDGAECANSTCGHVYAGHSSGLSGARCSAESCGCPRFYVDQRVVVAPPL
jgi:hypothetical protein